MRLDALPERNVMAPKPNTPSGFHDHLARRWAFDPVRSDREEIERAVKMIDSEPGSIGRKGDARQPTDGTGELRIELLQPVRRHGEERRFMRRGELAVGEAAAGRRADAEILSEPAEQLAHLVRPSVQTGQAPFRFR
jgi:hypothetical protein